MTSIKLKLLPLVFMLILLSGTTLLLAQDAPTAELEIGPTLATVLARGQLTCGVNEDVFGFGFLNPNTGDITGIDVELCTAIATAIFGDPTALDLRLLPLKTPPSDLLSGELDVALLHDLALNLTQDSNAGLDFGPVTFFDGQSIMVRRDSEIETWDDLSGETICAIADTLAASNLSNEMAVRNLRFELLTFGDAQAVQEAFLAGRCNVQTSERSLLEIRRQTTDVPDDFVVWEVPFTRIGKGPVYRYGDKQWSAIVDWTMNGLIYAEELGINSSNVMDFARIEGEDEEAYVNRVGIARARLLDVAVETSIRLGLAPNFIVPVIRELGNYGEIYDRHLGPTSALPINRSLNALWINGGLLESASWQ